MNSQESQIITLNSLVKVRIAPSKIHGVGIFAIRDLPKGSNLHILVPPSVFTVPYSSINKLFPEVKKLLLEHWPHIVNGSNFIYPIARIQSFINHSDEYNYDADKDETIKDIAEGEEITENYRLIENYQLVYPWLK